MSNKKETPDELDDELAEINKMNDGYMDLDGAKETEEEETPDEDEEDDEDSPKGDDDDDDGKDEEDEEDEDTDDEDSEEEDEESEDDEEKGKDPKDDTKRVARRPEKYVPVAKFKAEKAQWSEEKTQLQSQIDEMQKQLKGMTPAETDDVIEKWAEENDVSIDQAKGLVDLIKKSTGIEDIAKHVEAITAKTDEEADMKAFNKEWTEVVPELQKEFPNASKKAIARAQKLMDQMAHSPRYADKDLDYILFKEKNQFTEVLNSKAPKKGPVGSRRPGASKTDATSMTFEKDERTGKYDFTLLHGMKDGPEKQKVLDNLSPEAYSDYIDDIDDDNLEISRGGRKIRG
jgi:hypothetical protein